MKSDTGKTERYACDALNRLASWYDLARETTTTYSCDAVGNLLEVEEGGIPIQAFTYDAANQIKSASLATSEAQYLINLSEGKTTPDSFASDAYASSKTPALRMTQTAT